MASNPINVGIVGYGFSTKCFHLPFILPNPELNVYAFLQRATGLADAKRWGHCTVDFPQAKHYRTADDFFADKNIELVVICTHNHEEFVERALNAGKHGESPTSGRKRGCDELTPSIVVVEKPFVPTSDKAEKLVALAKEKGKVLTVFHSTSPAYQGVYHVRYRTRRYESESNRGRSLTSAADRRYDSDFRTLEHLVNKGALGEVMEAQMHFDFPNASWVNGYSSKYKPGDGMLFGLGALPGHRRFGGPTNG